MATADKTSFDTIVIGGGLAGLCCAGELVLAGKRPLLISETAEVGAVFPVQSLGGNNKFFIQAPLWQLGWGGGWWYGLARALNIPLKLYPGHTFAASIRGTGQIIELPICVTAKTFTDVLLQAFPFPIGDEARARLETVLERALAIPWEDLTTMQQVPLATWLEDNGADELVSTLLLTLGGAASDLTLHHAKENLSVFGGVGVLRAMLSGEGALPVVYPNTREGLCIPIANEIEQRGGTVWRGRKVQQVIVEGGTAQGVRLEDGTQVEAPVIAMACGNHRTGALLDPVPPEIVKALEHSKGQQMDIYTASYLLERPALPARHAIGVFDPATLSVCGWTWTITEVAPWTTDPGKQIVGTHIGIMSSDVDKVGEKEIRARMLELNEELCPGFADTILESRTHKARNGWMAPVSVGPKLPRTVPSADGLWFVSDGSEPCPGLWAEAAASCGVLAARGIVAEGKEEMGAPLPLRAPAAVRPSESLPLIASRSEGSGVLK